MERDRLLTATSLIAVALMTVHLSDDIARGFEPGGLTNLGGVLILVVWLAAILLLRTTRWGHVLLILGSLFTALMPVVHMSGNGVGRVAASSGGHFFVWTLLALGVTGTFALMLAVEALWRLRGARRLP